jgi:hypothetical protein
MKVLNPSGINPLNIDEKRKAIVLDAVIQAGANLHLPLKEISASYPSPLDDFDPAKIKVFWKATIDGLPPDWKGKPQIGGRLYWPEVPEEEQLKVSIIRSVSFAALVSLLPESKFVYSALEAFKYDKEFLSVATYEQEVIHMLNSSVQTIPASQNGGKEKHKLPSLAKAQQAVVDAIQKKSIDFLKDIHTRMQRDLDREDRED